MQDVLGKRVVVKPVRRDPIGGLPELQRIEVCEKTVVPLSQSEGGGGILVCSALEPRHLAKDDVIRFLRELIRYGIVLSPPQQILCKEALEPFLALLALKAIQKDAEYVTDSFVSLDKPFTAEQRL